MFTGAPAAARQLEIVATLPDLAALCREVAGDRARVTALLRGGEDPALAEPQPEQALLLSRADLLVTLGEPLEGGWLPRLLVAARNPRAAEYLDAARVLGPHAGAYALGDPRHAAAVAHAVATQLAVIDPPGAPAYRLAAAQLAADLERRSRAWLVQLGPARGRRVVSYGDTFGAFLAWAGLRELGTLSPAPGMPPTPVQALRLLRAMRDGGVHVLLAREYEPAHTLRLFQDKTGAHVVVAPLGARTERGERYAEGLDALVQAVAGAGRAP